MSYRMMGSDLLTCIELAMQSHLRTARICYQGKEARIIRQPYAGRLGRITSVYFDGERFRFTVQPYSLVKGAGGEYYLLDGRGALNGRLRDEFSMASADIDAVKSGGR